MGRIINGICFILPTGNTVKVCRASPGVVDCVYLNIPPGMDTNGSPVAFDSEWFRRFAKPKKAQYVTSVSPLAAL